MATAFVNFTESAFLSAYGINLEVKVPDDDSPDTKVSRFIADVCEQVLAYVDDNSPSFDSTDVTTYQTTTINKAAMMQAKYRLDNGDFRFHSGYDATNNTSITQGDIQQWILCPEAVRLLNHKIIDRSLGA